MPLLLTAEPKITTYGNSVLLNSKNNNTVSTEIPTASNYKEITTLQWRLTFFKFDILFILTSTYISGWIVDITWGNNCTLVILKLRYYALNYCKSIIIIGSYCVHLWLAVHNSQKKHQSTTFFFLMRIILILQLLNLDTYLS